MDGPLVVSREEWLVARKELLAKEKELSRQRDLLNAERRRLPMVEIDKQYVFEGRYGRGRLEALFDRPGPPLVYNFLFDPDVDLRCPASSVLPAHTCHPPHL